MFKSSIRIYVVPIDGSAPPLVLNGSETAIDFRSDPLGLRVVYTGFAEGRERVYSVPIDGSSAPTQLSQDGGIAFLIAPSGTHAVFVDQELVGSSLAHQLYGSPLDGSASPVPFAGSPFPNQSLESWAFHPDSTSLAYVIAAPGHETSIAPIDGSSAPLPLIAGSPPSPTFQSNLFFSPDGERLVFTGGSVGRDDTLYSIASDGSAPPVPLSPPDAIGISPGPALVLGGSSVVFLAAGRCYQSPLDGSVSATRLDTVSLPGGNVLEFAATGRTVVYRADQDTDGVPELFATFLQRRPGPKALPTAPAASSP